ncbi:20S pre-rRNA processing of protein [Pseudozyma hubeiensis SY62]|uniref:20S pre-rRNA processing of protein n=1 Tax=Pseudozyma hubeiensis (strain SY62) TaxID=1305764 RepID=R9P8E6_PSEHS|nr:20S pre-rRNA processing of protein [Pseudozyma hubeiensis SY62]GAC97646.1 20S pre-rRNA processing of protein [Pseudozyma hubeiensis SY62]
MSDGSRSENNDDDHLSVRVRRKQPLHRRALTADNAQLQVRSTLHITLFWLGNDSTEPRKWETDLVERCSDQKSSRSNCSQQHQPHTL